METETNLSLVHYRNVLGMAELRAHNAYLQSRTDSSPTGSDALWNAYQEAVAARRDAGIEAGASLEVEE